MSKRNNFVFTVLQVIAWIIFVGLSIEAGALLVNFIYSLFKPEVVHHLYQKLDLSEMYERSKWAYFGMYGLFVGKTRELFFNTVMPDMEGGTWVKDVVRIEVLPLPIAVEPELLVTGNVDISVGAQMSFLGVMVAMIIQKMLGLPEGNAPAWQAALGIPLAIVVTFAVGAVMGLINGIVVVKSRAASFIISLGFMSVYHGAALLLSGGASYMLYSNFEWLGRERFFDLLPVSILFFAAMMVLAWLVLKFTRYGRFLYAIGGNKKAAFVSGIRTVKAFRSEDRKVDEFHQADVEVPQQLRGRGQVDLVMTVASKPANIVAIFVQ